MRRLLIASLCAVYISVAALISPASAEPYGSGPYGGCAYQADCPTPPPSPTPKPPVPPEPEPAPTPPQAVVTTPGLADNQTITENPFTIVVSVADTTPEDGTQPEVGWVTFYVDDKLLGTTYNPSSDGTYQYEWDVSNDPGKRISIAVYNKTGEIIARKDVAVKVSLPGRSTPPLPISTPTSVDNGPGIGAIGELIHQTPPIIAKSFPYWLFIILLILAVRLIWQAVRETIGNGTMQTLLTKQRLISDEKDNFIALSSHYLHTPLTVIGNGADTMAAVKEASPEALAPLKAAVEKLRVQIDDILGQVESNSILGSIKPPTESTYTISTFRSPYFWIPVAAVGAICLLANFLFGVVGEIELGLDNLFVQVGLFIVTAVFFAFSYRTHRIRKREHAKSKQLVDYQNAIDSARNTFIDRSTEALSQGLAEVDAARTPLAETPTKRYVNEGYGRFNDILAKFRLLAQLQTGAAATGVATFPLKEALDTALLPFKDQIEAKKLNIHTNTHNVNVTQNPQLFSYVMQTVIDNAIKFSDEGGEISIAASKASGKLEISVIDNGIGIPAEKLPSLFKPFSRAGSALQFDYEGLGFSLFLDKIIMDYLEGDISARSDQTSGTVITVTA